MLSWRKANAEKRTNTHTGTAAGSATSGRRRGVLGELLRRTYRPVVDMLRGRTRGARPAPIGEAPRSSEEGHRGFGERLPDIIYCLDAKGNVVSNSALKNFFGFEPQGAVRRDFAEFAAKNILPQALTGFGQLLTDKRTTTETFMFDRSEKPYVIEHSTVPIIKGGKVVGLLGIVRDVTERKQLEEELRMRTKMEFMGQLAGGIAHDSNNLLCVIQSNVFSARKGVKNDSLSKEELIEMLTDAEEGCRRITRLNHQLLDLSQERHPMKETTSLAKLVKDTANLVLRSSNVKAEYHLPEDPLLSHVDKTQISGVIQNIVFNAVEAMPSGGGIKISASKISVGPGNTLFLEEGNYVRLSFEDQGEGVPDDIRAKIFEPCFTTKDKGHGLGLATSYSIIKKHDGRIEVESEPRKGATFHIYLPVSDEQPVIEQEETQAVTNGGGGCPNPT